MDDVGGAIGYNRSSATDGNTVYVYCIYVVADMSRHCIQYRRSSEMAELYIYVCTNEI